MQVDREDQRYRGVARARADLPRLRAAAALDRHLDRDLRVGGGFWLTLRIIRLSERLGRIWQPTAVIGSYGGAGCA
jgi:hypothetical protein